MLSPMMKRTLTAEELAPTQLTVTLKSHIVRDLKEMERVSKQSLEEIVTKALQMFIATHSDYLARPKLTQQS